jgi:pilus assembly protein CpaF
MNTGHDGSISTIHANTPRDAMARLETMVMMSGMDLTIRAIREQAASALNLVIQQQRLKDGSRHLTHVTEVVGLEGDVVTLQDIFHFDFKAGMDEHGHFKGKLEPTGLRPQFLEKLEDAGVKIDRRMFQPGMRAV